MELPQDAQEKIKQLQNYEQKVQALGLQRHKVEGELTEIESILLICRGCRLAASFLLARLYGIDLSNGCNYISAP